MDPSIVDNQFEYLSKELKNWRISAKEEFIKRRYVKVLEDSDSSDLSLLEKSLQDEQIQLKKLHTMYEEKVEGE